MRLHQRHPGHHLPLGVVLRLLLLTAPPATIGFSARHPAGPGPNDAHPGVISAEKAGFTWSCDFGWAPIVAAEGSSLYQARIDVQNKLYETGPSFRYYENKLTEHEYFQKCQLPHAKVHQMGYFNPEHGPVFDDSWLDSTRYPYIARFASEGMSRGTFKIDDDEDKATLRTTIADYRTMLAQTGATYWGLTAPREGILISELVVGATEISAYVSFGLVGTIWWRVDTSGKDVKNWQTWKFMNLFAQGDTVVCLDWQQNNIEHATCRHADAAKLTGLLPRLQQLANQITLDWRVPWWRFDIFLLPDGKTMLVNEMSFPGHMVNDARDSHRFNAMVALAEAEAEKTAGSVFGQACRTPPAPHYNCNTMQANFTTPIQEAYRGGGPAHEWGTSDSASSNINIALFGMPIAAWKWPDYALAVLLLMTTILVAINACLYRDYLIAICRTPGGARGGRRHG